MDTLAAAPAPAATATDWSPATLAAALQARHARSLALFRRLQAGIGAGGLPRYLPELSPPAWDLGHLAWRESRLIGRNPGLLAGQADPQGAHAADPDMTRADAWFDDRQVSHPARWHQLLPPAEVLAAWAARTRERSLRLLGQAARRQPAWPLFARVVAMEDALHEDWLAMAQTLGMDPGTDLPEPAPVPAELAGPRAGGIDLAPVTWAQVLAFVEAGGYTTREHWSREGWAWRQRHNVHRPRLLAAPDPAHDPSAPPAALRRACFGRWVPLDPAQPAMGLSLHEAEAWCRWAGRRLPRRAEWRAAVDTPGFAWGQVWDWVADDADGPAVLLGASVARPAAGEPGERALPPERHDGFWGFRSAPLS